MKTQGFGLGARKGVCEGGIFWVGATPRTILRPLYCLGVDVDGNIARKQY